MEGLDDNKEDVSDNDLEEEVLDNSLFSMGMTRHEKLVARKPWRTSLIIKLVAARSDINIIFDACRPCGEFNLLLPLLIYLMIFLL